MHESGAVDIVGVFGPEHGFRGTAQAGDSEGTHPDPRTGLMVYDAYGANTAEDARRLSARAGVETVVFDIQDVGARFYTYIWTMYTAMQAAVAAGARFVVLDRPNPIGGTASGPMMTTPCTSGVGAKEIVQAARHDGRRARPATSTASSSRRRRGPAGRALRDRGQGLAP